MALTFLDRKTRISLVGLLALFTIFLWTVLRLILWIYTGPTQMTFIQSIGVFVVGFIFDLATLAFLIVPFLLVAAFIPDSWREAKWYLKVRWFIAFVMVYALGFGVVSEIVFWIEFTTRFNFIAVDYLVYTHEVIGNIMESYPIPLLLSLIALAVIFLLWIFSRSFVLDRAHKSKSNRFVLVGLAVILPLVSAQFINLDQSHFSKNNYANELAGNGLYGFSAAFRRNDLDYAKFYATIDQAKADEILKNLAVERTAAKPSTAASNTANLALPEVFIKRPKNIVLVSVESLSAHFVGAYGSSKGLTPEIDKLAKNGVQFDRLFATGTRTVRGLEALSLGTPPIPGQAIVHRPKNDQLDTLGMVLRDKGFNTYFIYGGYGYFDNMNAYFKGNLHEVKDRTDFAKETIAGENIWGVADESLFGNAVDWMDQSASTGKPFFAHIMTTSNHRPYTFPEGRIDMPSGSRDAAVKYTDYSIGQLISKAQNKSWFKDTLFVIVADHCASVAGKTQLPVAGYHIAGLMYGPDIVKPQRIGHNLSQIDIPPTLLQLTGTDPAPYFFGEPIWQQKNTDNRVFISNYQELGYYKNNDLIVLSPKQKVEAFKVDPATMESTPTEVNETLKNEAIAFYQTAAKAFKNGELKFKKAQ